jgi:NAD(P)-dependent dehydrogenase (short-subunit alcohol dehydrogenase family)
LRVAVVTGGGSGIGAALASTLAGRDWLCVLIGRREGPLQATASEVGGEYEVCDVADRDAVERMAASVRERHPEIGLLVNNAGVAGRGNYLDLPPERIEELIRINYLGSVWCLQAFLPALEAAAPSHLVNVVSVAGTVAVGPYSASKHAQLAFSRATSASLRRRGISVHTLNPGFVETEGFPQRATLRSPFFRRQVIDPDRVAQHVAGLIGAGPGETTIPRWYRLPGILQALAPNLVARLVARRGDTYR